MRPAYEGGIERDHVHEGPQPERPLGKAPTQRHSWRPDGRVEKELDRIIPRLAMDLDQTGEIRSAPIVDPVVVCEPRIVARQRDELARARVIDPEPVLLAPVEHA